MKEKDKASEIVKKYESYGFTLKQMKELGIIHIDGIIEVTENSGWHPFMPTELNPAYWQEVKSAIEQIKG